MLTDEASSLLDDESPFDGAGQSSRWRNLHVGLDANIAFKTAFDPDGAGGDLRLNHGLGPDDEHATDVDLARECSINTEVPRSPKLAFDALTDGDIAAGTHSISIVADFSGTGSESRHSLAELAVPRPFLETSGVLINPTGVARYRKSVTVFAIVALLAVLPSFSVLGAGFVWDDHPQLLLNSHLTLQSIPGYWLESESGFAEVGRSSRYNPLGWTLFALENHVSGGSPAPGIFHATSLLMHGICAGLLFVLLGMAGRALSVPTRLRPLVALAVSLVFAWGPAQAEVVAWPSARFESLALALLLAGTLLSVRSRAPWGWVLAGAIVALSLFAKESTLGLVLLFPALGVLGPCASPPAGAGGAVGSPSSAGSRSVWGATGAYSVLLLFFALRSFAGVGLPSGVAALQPDQILLAALRILSSMILPTDLSLMRGLPLTPSLPDLLVGGALVFVGILGFLKRGQLVGRFALVGLAFCVLPTLPGAVAAARFELLPDRYSYLGAPGLSLLLLCGLALSFRRVESEASPRARLLVRLLVSGLLFALFVFAGRVIEQAPRWANDVDLFAWEVEHYPELPQSHYHLGLARRMAGDLPGAEEALMRSAELGPSLWQTWAELARTRAQQGDIEAASWTVQQGIRAVGPGSPLDSHGAGASSVEPAGTPERRRGIEFRALP